MSLARIKKNLLVPELTVLSGPSKGSTFQLVGQTISIGRDADNDIVIKDDKVSRKHALLTINPNGIYIENINPRNFITTQKGQVQNLIITTNTKIKLGDTQIVINIPTKQPAMSLANQAQSGFSHSSQKAKMSGLDKGRIRFYSIVALILGALAYFILSPGKKETDAPKFNTQEVITEKLEQTKEQLSNLKNRKIEDRNMIIFNQKVKSFYIKGFRDFQQGQFDRAIASFSACLSLSPSHQLCNKYLHLSQKKKDELIQYHMRSGRRSLDKKQYQSCMSSFKNVIYTIQNSSDPVQQEAELNHEICELRLKGGI